MSPPHGLTRLQLAVMQVLWRCDGASTTEIHRALQARRKLALTTVATLLSRLEKKGLVERSLAERPYVYRARVREQEVRSTLVGEVMEGLFRDDVAAMVSHLLGNVEVTPEDLERVKALIAAKEREMEEGRGR